MDGLLDYAVADRIAIIRLNRPERLNAFNSALHDALRHALDGLEHEPDVRALILTGAGRAFCAGQDLNERADAFARDETPDLGASLADNYNPLVRRIAALPYPSIAAVNGIASGAGAALAIACDLVIACKSARFQFGFVRVALGPDAGTSWHLPWRVGAARALALALTGEAVGAERALDIGLADMLVADAELEARAQALARQLADGPASAIAAIKQALRVHPPASLEAALEAERQAQQQLGRHPDYREAVTAFAARRPPHFTEGQAG